MKSFFFRVKMKQESLWREQKNWKLLKKKNVSSPLFSHLVSLRFQTLSPTSLLFKKILFFFDERKMFRGAVGLPASFPTRFFQGVATIQALPLRPPSRSLSPPPTPFCQMFQWRSPPDGETFTCLLSLSLPVACGGASPSPALYFPSFRLPAFPSSAALSSFPSSLRRYMWAD